MLWKKKRTDGRLLKQIVPVTAQFINVRKTLSNIAMPILAPLPTEGLSPG